MTDSDGASAGVTSIHEVVQLHGRSLGGKPAIVDDVQIVSYASLAEGVRALALRFAADGLGNGAVVGVALDPSPLHLAVILALGEAGAVACLVNVRLDDAEIATFVATVGLTHLIVDPSSERLQSLVRTSTLLPSAHVPFRAAIASLWPGDVPPNLARTGHERTEAMRRPAIAFPTGGTTGSPKAAVWSGAGLAAIAASNCVHIEVRREDRELYFSPFFHVSLVTGLFAPLYAGATVQLAGTFDPARVVPALESGTITRFFAVPAALDRLVAWHRSRGTGEPLDTAGVRVVVFGASGSKPGFVELIHTTFPAARVFTGYGASEFGPVTRAYPAEVGEPGRYGVGRPVAGTAVMIVDDDGNELRDGDTGEIVVRAPWQMSGYLGDHDVLSWRLRGGVRTGDLGMLDDGYLHLRGRSKDLIKSGGEQVFPAEVERVVAGHPDVVDVAVYGVPDDMWGERVECAVVLTDAATVSVDDLRQHCRSRMAAFKVPKRIVVVDALPYTSNLKLDRRALVRKASDA